MVILIADDEPKIRRGLAAHLEALRDPRISRIDTASNGIETMEKIKALHPDIVLLDLCMPQMSGIQLIEALSLEQDIPCIIIISGYDDFSYAKTALRYGVYDYLVKPLHLEELDSTLRRAMSDLTIKREQQKKNEILQRRYESSRNYLLDSLFRKIVRGLVSGKEIPLKMKELNIPFPSHGCIIAVQIQLSGVSDSTWEMEADLYDYALHNVLEETCAALHQCTCFVNWDRNCAILFDLRNEDTQPFLDTLKNNLEMVFSCTVHCAIGSVASPEEIGRVYKRLIRHDQTSLHIPAVSATIRDVQEHYSDFTLSLQEVADAVGFSPAYLSKSMRLNLGVTFSQYLTDYRMQVAAKFLRDPHCSLKLYEIATQCGFSSQHYFSRAFRKYFGLSPTQYRESFTDGGQELEKEITEY